MTTSSTSFPTGTILGYPRIGPNRELKFAVEAYWKGKIDYAELTERARVLRAGTRERLAALGLGRGDSAIPENFSYYDHVLDASITTGIVPERFADVVDGDGRVDLAGYFTIARGEGDRLPVEMTKWFDTNYHYSVPEVTPATPIHYADSALARRVAEAREAGYTTRPVIVGPVTLLALAKPGDSAPEGYQPIDRLDDVVAAYAALLADLRAAGAEWVQFDEPALVAETLPLAPAVLADAAARAYAVLGNLSDRPAIFVAAPYASLEAESLSALSASPIEAIGFDLVRGQVPTELSEAQAVGLKAKHLVAGVVDGHNIWRTDLGAALAKAQQLGELGAGVSVSTSTSLIHVPHTLQGEDGLPAALREWLAFADEKVAEVEVLARGLRGGAEAIAAEIAAVDALKRTRAAADGVHVPAVAERLAALTPTEFTRVDYATREAAQRERIHLPALPTTTIGSFPQTPEIRSARAAYTKGKITTDEYEEFVRAEIARVIALQEELGLDVLVHGEAERNDMVQYFAENLDGFSVTRNGWVQSYGSRATRPSILWGDVSRPAPITVRWSTYAQSLTEKPVKGMLTGPVTILAWSFVRDDQPLGVTANQVALALRDEIVDLETAGIGIIQVDEPALRELLPLKAADHQAYLDWSVDSFRLATSGVAPETQIHTHLCYSEFGAIIGAIRGLDADVTSIEAARSRMEVVGDLAEGGFDHGIGPGVYDIHSPRVPSVREIEGLLETAVDGLDPRILWVNPDCGLKTRGYDETVASLRNIVEATGAVRAGRLTPTA